MSYDDVFDGNIDKEFFFNKPGYPDSILMDGFISLGNANGRLTKGEYYSLVIYDGKEQLPGCYVPVDSRIIEGAGIESENKFATIRSDLALNGISIDGGIQVLTNLPSPEDDAIYCLKPGSKKVLLSELVQGQLEAYKNMNRKTRQF